MSSSSSAIQAAKQLLRKQIRAKLSAIADQSLSAQSAAITRKVLAHPVYQRAQKISIYVSMPTSELRTDAIIRHALENNKKLFIPYLPPAKGSRMQFLALKDLKDFEALKPDKWKIRSLPEEGIDQRENALDEATGSGLDLILMPGLAFDRQLNRLGHGKGYYDSYLSQCAQYSQKHSLQSPYTIALALNEQILEEKDGRIPTIDIEDGHSSAHKDIKPDELIFPDGEVSSD